MKRTVFLFVVGVLAFPFHLSAQSDTQSAIQQKFLGTWQLVSYVREGVPFGAKSDVMGAHPHGYINYGRDGRMMVMIVGTDRKKPAASVATPAQAAALLKSMLAYAGTFTIDSKAKTVAHHIEISWDESRTGIDQTRSFKLEGNHLTLTTGPSTDPVTGEKTVRQLVWEKLNRLEQPRH
ncbi:MAG: lipocalin-like domain-containing protein [Acidobacteria bacterium]|nr:lipocalin-like domain-containing protein [Acidobacteriota bacterium]